MLSLFSKQDIIKAYMDKKHADCEDKIWKIGMSDESESQQEKRIRDLVQKDFAEEFKAIGLSIDDYFDELNDDDFASEDYTPVEFFNDILDRVPNRSEERSREEFFDRYCAGLATDFDKGNMHGYGVKLEIDDVIPMYDFESDDWADKNIENVVKYNTKSLNEVMRGLGHEEFPETAEIETKLNIRNFCDLDTGDETLDDLGVVVATSGNQQFEDLGNGKVLVKTKLHGASYGYPFSCDNKSQDFLIYINSEFEHTLTLDQKIIDELIKMQDVSMYSRERRNR